MDPVPLLGNVPCGASPSHLRTFRLVGTQMRNSVSHLLHELLHLLAVLLALLSYRSRSASFKVPCLTLPKQGQLQEVPSRHPGSRAATLICQSLHEPITLWQQLPSSLSGGSQESSLLFCHFLRASFKVWHLLISGSLCSCVCFF